MKKLILAIVLSLAIPVAALASAKLSPAYRAKFCYPGGSYYVNQIAHYPAYYAAHNAQYLALYGPTTAYCPI